MAKDHCPHCFSTAPHRACVKCNRDMCDDCIHVGDMGLLCGLCLDRENGLKTYERLQARGKLLPDFEDWYDQTGGYDE